MFKLLRKILLIVFILAFIVVGIIGGIGYLDYRKAVDEVSVKERVAQIEAKEHYTSINDVSPYFKDAVVAIEDHRFYEHGGIDYISLIRVTLANIIAQEVVGGGSTITQQLAKNMYFDQSVSMTRKVSEAFVANVLEEDYKKDKILELYINCIYYGDGYYGIYDASMGYFNVTPDQLTLAQASILAGLPQAPSLYQLSNHYEAAAKRQVDVLNAMLEHEYINKTQYKQALAKEVR